MSIEDQISELEKKIKEVTHPPKEIEHTEIKYSTGRCEKHGEYEVRERHSTGPIKLPASRTGCLKCMFDDLTALRKRQQADSDRNKAATVQALLNDLKVPERFANATLDNYEEVNQEAERNLKICKLYAEKWLDRRAKGGGLVMCGKPGTGKNHLALAIAKLVVTEHQNSALFTTALRIVRDVKSTWSRESTRTEDDVIRHYCKVDLLVIDEIGVQFGSDSEKMILFEVINTRYEQMKPTILISNLNKEGLIEFVGERVIDRMNDGGGCTLAFTWDSYRGKR